MSKIYDFLPGHLKNSELETIFETTLERVFSKGDMEKVRAFVGRKEKGINSEKDIYLNFPPHAHARDNYGLEPTFSSTDQKVFYEDLINSLFNKGALTNDHRRLFDTDKETINIPIDLDKFVNWSMYYWVNPGFVGDGSVIENADKHYVTIGRGGTDWWSTKNAWYHYDDIRDKITDSNHILIEQAKRPIIEFDKRLELSDTSAALATNADWTFPTFKIYTGENPDEAYLKDGKIFSYTLGDVTLYESDTELGFTPVVKSGDYISEYCFETDMPDDSKYKFVVPGAGGSIEFQTIYIKTEFDYRNFRQEFGRDATNVLTLSQTPKNENAIDVYIDGIKQINNYSVNSNVITFNVSSNPEGFVYVDYCTNGPVTTDGDDGFQRIHHSLEYNVENKTYNNTQIPYSTWYEHFVRIIETVPGLSGEPNGVNNYRTRGDNTDKVRHNNQGSVLVRNSIDITDAYFSLSRNDYDPISAFEFLSTAYQSYKNKLVTTIIEILQTSGSQSKSDLQILEDAISTIALSKRQSISIFDNLFKINYGEQFSNYQEEQLSVVANTDEQFLPNNISQIVKDTELTIIKNNKILILGIDYSIPASGDRVLFTTTPLATDVIMFRKYDSVKEAYIPPSSTFLKINPSFIPGIVTDRMYTTNPPSADYEFIQGHDGSITPKFGDRTDDVLLMFETLVYNSLENKSVDIARQTYGPYQRATGDWELYEKNYTMYPFFKKWMIRNNIDNLHNTSYDPNDWTTWNYRTIDADSPGHWRGLYIYAYHTDNPLEEPWKVVGLSQEPSDFKNKHGINFNTVTFWNNLFSYYNITGIPVPVDSNGDLKEPNDLFFNSSITNAEISLMKEDWEFGDGGPAEMAWRRSSEYPFIEFILMMLTRPFKIFYDYSEQIAQGITIYNSREGFDTTNILAEKSQYEFKLGSKLGGFVNNFRLLAENTSLNNSRYTDIPKDNYDLVIHSGEPNRSEFFSAILVEKVSLDESYPTYLLSNTTTYVKGDIVLNSNDGKYYRRKETGQSTAEASGNITFDYSSWVMISQPKTRKYGYRIQGYDDFNPTFFAMEWDKASGEKAFSTKGDRENLNEWQKGAFYRQNAYMKYEGQPYVCLREHTSSTLLDDNINDWKQLVEWPKTNIKTVYGYNKFQNDQIKSFNYGQILENLDDVAHLMLGYQKYLEFIGWGFTDIDEAGQTIDYEQLLYKFLEWCAEDHGPGEFITLSPMLITGSFTAPYGVASVRKETHKNFYRVVNASGRLIPNSEIDFTTNGKTINFRSSTPVFGMKIDVQDVEHAFVVDKVDSFGDVIYDPFLHNRNLRMQIDCNRSANWDGTLGVDGFIPYGDELLPNFETLTSDSKYFRDTLVDQNLEIVNRLKASQIGYTKRDYLRNHGIERESQLEFYKGFLSHKGTNSAINRIVNNNGNFKEIEHHNIWAFKRAEYGKLNTGYKINQSVNTVDMISDPHTVQFDGIINALVYRPVRKAFPIKTTGYVDGRDVTYTVQTEYDLENLNTNTLSEGETAWVQFDPVREWDVKRLSEIAEIGYIGETNDNQLYVGLTNQVTTTDSVYLKIRNTDIEPEIADYYYLVENGTREVDGVTIYEYLVFELNYEPLIVEIDSSTTDSLFVPTGSESAVEAIGSVSFPTFASGDALVIDGEQFTYTPGAGGGSTGIVLGGSTATVDPIVSEGEQARIIVYNSSGAIANTNTLITFDGTSATGSNGVTANNGDEFTINGDSITVAFSATQSIEAITQTTISDNLTTGGTLIFDSTNETQQTVTAREIEFTGTTANPTITGTKSLSVNGTVITFSSASASTENKSVASQTSSTLVTTDLTSNVITSIVKDNGYETPSTIPTSEYSVNGQLVTFNPALNNVLTLEDYYQKLGYTDSTYNAQDIALLEQFRTDFFNISVPAGGNADTVWDSLIDAVFNAIETGTYSQPTLNVPPYTTTYINDINALVAQYIIDGQALQTSSGITPVSPTFLTQSISNDPLRNFLINNSSTALTPTTVIYDEPIDLTFSLSGFVPTQTIINTINSSSAPIIASQDSSNNLVIDSSANQLTISGNALTELGLSTSSLISESKLNLMANDINAISYLTAFINSNDQLQIETSNDDLQISGTLRSPLGLLGTYDATDDPTSQSIVNQINASNISGISATRVGSNIKITSSTNQLDIQEVTTGAMSRLGFTTNPVDVDSVTTIRDNINEALSNLTNTNATIVNRQIVITSDQSSIVLENVQGNPWNDIGIAVGTYNSSAGQTTNSVTEFKDQINSATTNILASVTSDGRMVFSNNNVSLSFSGTSQEMLDKIGLFGSYSAVTSNPNFKAMRWKSVRYTQFYLFDTFDGFYNDLGLNAQALVWADDYSNNGWAVLNRDATGTLSVRNRQADIIEPDYTKRVILQDGENFNKYQLFDPINLKFPGEIIKNLDYITWEDPARYDEPTSKELWLDDWVGTTWWDTSLARYYRYNDYGDENGTLVESFASRYWGKLVPGSEINVKKWTKSETLPDNITTYSSKVYFDTDRNKSITEYFYWSEIGSEPTEGKTISIEEIKMLLESGNIKNKFIPIGADKILISNNAYIFENPTVNVCLEYNTGPDTDKSHSDWELIQEYTEKRPHFFLIAKLIESLSNVNYQSFTQRVIDQSNLGDPDNTRVNISFIDAGGTGLFDIDASLNDTVVTVNNNIIEAQYLTFFTDGNPNNAQVWISKEYNIIVGDVIRVYRMVPTENSWFTNLQSARENFASSINSHFASRHLITNYPNYQDYIQANNLSLSLQDWYLTDEYKKIERFQYLSKTRTFDMLKLYNDDNVKSFKLELPTGNEYYFEHEGVLRLVNSEDSALSVSFTDIVFPSQDDASKPYYENALGLQIQELFALILNQEKSDETNSLINRIFFDMINYLYTEKTYPDWIFKTSYIDLNLFNRNLRKYAIYQRDSYDDVIEYITEAKPYHTKIREVWRYYGKEENVNADVDITENMNITLDFGNNKRYSDNILDGGNPELDDPTLYPEDGTYEAGRLLRTRYTNSDGTGADEFDTGLVNAGFRDSSVVFVDQYTDANQTTHEKTFMYIYDMFGRGWKVDVKGESTVSSFDGSTLIVDTSSEFDEVGESDKKLIALRNETTGNIEFMTYDKKNTVNLDIADRGLYTGCSTGLGSTNKAYALGTPLEIVLHDMV